MNAVWFFSTGGEDSDEEGNCDWLCSYYGKKVLIFLVEYDTPMQEACIHGFWDEQILYNQLDANPDAVWSLLLATGYLKIVHAMTEKEGTMKRNA